MSKRRRSFAKGAGILFAFSLIVFACRSRQSNQHQLLIYTPHGQDMLRDFVGRYKQAHPDADVQFLDMGSREVPRLDRPNSTTGCLNVTKTGATAS